MICKLILKMYTELEGEREERRARGKTQREAEVGRGEVEMQRGRELKERQEKRD